MRAAIQPFGRVSSRGEQQRGAACDLRVALLIVVPVVCLVVVLYEFLYLQEYTAHTTAGDRLVAEQSARLRSDDAAAAATSLSQPLAATRSIVNDRRTIVLVANYRDSTRCSETLRSIFDNAAAPDNLKISIYDQIYPARDERSCADVFCELVGQDNCRREQIVSSQIDAVNATGPTAARYETEKAITDEHFCLTIDSHMIFVRDWDEKIIAQWDSIENPNAIISIYPKSTEHLTDHGVDDLVQLMCMSRIETNDRDAMVQYAAPAWINKKDTPKPRLMSQLAGGFNFGDCKQVKEVRNDPYTPYLFHGEEYSRATRLWTAGYDFYAPSEDVAYHWYETRKVVWERNWSKRYAVQQKSKRRVRAILHLPVTKEDFDHTDLEKFALGTKRTLEQWKEFSGIDPLAKFVSPDDAQFDNCKQLEYVPY
ncbi:unnamed protein product [Hyaloperonospora brassicae]|uniref:Glycosyltransferase 2-like domain-containing protein n=1 Tax=Hyaloperonospora brassicae TaxID=162125 RepID=A0AAV0TXL3_HYABA|nr:unnamed protein product [Hyaloperonospora brassicae]